MKTHEFDRIEDWLAARQTISGIPISSTDAPVITGVSRFRSPLELYHQKRKAVREIEPRYAEMARWGRELEDVIARRYCINTGREIERTGNGKFVLQQSDDTEWMIASCDRYAIVDPLQPVKEVLAGVGDGDERPEPRTVLAPVGVKIVLELKNAHFMSKDNWASETEPPLEYLVQLQHQLAVTGMPWGSLAALIGGVEFRWADVQRNDSFIATLLEKEEEFRWRVEKGLPPEADGHPGTARVIRELYPEDNGTTIELPPEAIEWANELEAASADEKAAKERKDTAANRLKGVIGEATVGTLRDGRAYSFKTQHRKEFVSKATSFRVLRKLA